MPKEQEGVRGFSRESSSYQNGVVIAAAGLKFLRWILILTWVTYILFPSITTWLRIVFGR